MAGTRPVRDPRGLQYRCRNLLRRWGFEIVRVSSQSSLLALHLARLFDQRQINCVLDVGARIGDYGVWLRRNGFTGRIVSFEPVAGSYRLLEARSGPDPRWRSYQLALGAGNEVADINVARLSYFNSFLEPNDYSSSVFGEASEVARTERVHIRRLDDVFADVTSGLPNPRVYLKMDTQGWDLEVLTGAEGCLEHVVALQSEVSVRPIYEGMPPFTRSIERFEKLGFALSGLFPVNLDRDLQVIEFDCVVVR